MTYRDTIAEEARSASTGSDSGSEERESLDQIDVDFSETPFVKFYPTSLPSGTFPEDEGNPIIRFPDEDNNDHRHQGYLGLVMDDLSVVTDEDEGMDGVTILETDEDDTTEYRIVDLNDENTTEKSGGDAVNIDGDTYWVDDTHTSLDERVILVVDRTASRSVANRLDINGATNAGMDEATGDVNGGLIEYAPDEVDAEVGWRYARNPELRDELYGTEVGVMVARRSEIDSGATGYVGEDGDPTDDDPVVGLGEDGETHTDPGRATYEELVAADERRDMMWYSVFNMETGEPIEPTEGDPTGYSYLEWRFDASVGYLPDEDYEFVQSYVDEGLPVDEETILKNIEDNGDKLSEDPNTDRMVNLIQSYSEE